MPFEHHEQHWFPHDEPKIIATLANVLCQSISLDIEHLKKYSIQNTLCDDFEMILFSANKCTKKNSSSNHNQCCDAWMRSKAKQFRQLATFVYSICKQKSPNIALQSHASRFYVFIFARFIAMNFFWTNDVTWLDYFFYPFSHRESTLSDHFFTIR